MFEFYSSDVKNQQRVPFIRGDTGPREIPRLNNPSCCDLANRHFQQSLFLHCSAFYRVVVLLLLVLDCGGVGALQCILLGAGGVGGE